MVDRAVERFGRLDVLVSNAGVLAPNGRIHNLTDADWQRVIDINLMGSVNAVRAAVPAMRQQKSGSIILTASVAGMTAWSHAAPYCVTKAAVIHLAKVAAVEYAADNIRVNCVCPGTFVSPIHADLPQQAIDAMAAKHPMGLGSADRSRRRVLVPGERRLAVDDRLVDRRRRRLLGPVIPEIGAEPSLSDGSGPIWVKSNARFALGRAKRVQQPSSRAMTTCWISLVPFADLEHLRVAVEAGHRRLEHVADAAVDLHRLRRRRRRQPARLQLGHRRLLEERLARRRAGTRRDR